MKKFGLFVLLIIFNSSSLAEELFYVEPEIAAYYQFREDEFHRIATIQCAEDKYHVYKNFETCLNSVKREYRNTYPLRGYNYAEKHYAKLTNEEAYAKLKELHALWLKAPAYTPSTPIIGLVTKKTIETEGWYIFKEVLKLDVHDRSFVQAGFKGRIPFPFINENKEPLEGVLNK